jgi:hypothetical protein
MPSGLVRLPVLLMNSEGILSMNLTTLDNKLPTLTSKYIAEIGRKQRKVPGADCRLPVR